MYRYAFTCGLLAAVCGLAWAWPAPAPRGDERRPEPLPERLLAPVNFAGIEDPKLTLQDVLEHLADRYELTFDVNSVAFQASPADILKAQVLQTPLPAMKNVSLDRIIRKVLSRLDVPATYTLRRDGGTRYVIEITTVQAQRSEIWGAEYQGPFLPLVHADFKDRSLADALKDLADRTGYNVVLDARAAEKGKTVVSARLLNTPLDTAVRLLADMADLRPYLVDNLLYVTTKENAARLEQQEKQRALQEGAESIRRGGSVPAVPMNGPGA
jgi:hypothetical protein